MKKKNNKSNNNWILKITIMAFTLSLLFSLVSEMTLRDSSIIVGIILIVLFVFIGVLFDMIGVSVTSADISPFNAMSARKIKGADLAVKFIKSASTVSSFCNDVVGDICGIISGSATAIVASSIAVKLNIPILYTTLVITSIVAALTISGKAIGKEIALNSNVKIISIVSKICSIFYNPKK